MVGGKGLSSGGLMTVFGFCRAYRILAIAAVLSMSVMAAPSSGQGRPADRQSAESPSACEALRAKDFASLPDAATSIMTAQRVAAAPDKPAHCRITGIVAPQIQFELRLPDDWNGRYLQGGCGGFCGFMPIDGCADGQARGFAVAASNLGHVGAVWAPPVWASNPALRADFGGRATHSLAVAAKAIIAAYYGRRPSYSYFKGCSTGGREGLGIAQQHPEDFDGIVAGDPAFAGRLGGIWNNWTAHQLMTPDNTPTFAPEDLTLLNGAVLKACDGLDGVRDGILTDARQCRFDPAQLQCRSGAKGRCLSAAQVAAARAMYGGARNSAGLLLYPGGAPYGSELDWNGPMMAAISQQSLRFLAFPEIRPAFDYKTFDWDRDVKALESTAAVYDPVVPHEAPDLAAFKARGGRMIAYHGGSDWGVPPEGMIDYYAQVWNRSGGLARTREWFRLFIVPGMFHCRGGAAPNNFDMLTAIVDWVEKGTTPDGIVAEERDERGALKRSRPLYAYPNVARYIGKGDENDGANWTMRVVQPGEDRADWIWKPTR